MYDEFGGEANKASVLHDYLYTTKIVSRRLADAVFYEAMLSTKVAKWRALSMWLAVRLFGTIYWNQP